MGVIENATLLPPTPVKKLADTNWPTLMFTLQVYVEMPAQAPVQLLKL